MILGVRQWLLMFILFLYAGFAAAVKPATLPGNELRLETKNKATEIVKSIFPSVAVERVLPSPDPDWVVVASGDQLVYVNVERRLVFRGVLIDEKNRTNLTDEVKSLIMADVVKNFPLENVITYVNGNGSRHLLVFEDPYCKYCRVFTEEVSSLTNATIHVVLYPVLKQRSVTMAAKIWCAPDRAKAWHDWIVNSKEPSNKGSCKTPLEKNIELGHRYSVTGTPTMFVMTGQRMSGAPNVEEIDRMLGD
ncbi:DsbC family protein [Candidatus Ichthyocystis hellenicum]|uniref:DsbC family protein n=1 Tax=Candidatus Ichthyocystis hellenicum TaxID=1561003 RepID=UPI000A90E13A|nr:DsbC family protein [Candidatus Ichthyocystis hellenicum]